MEASQAIRNEILEMIAEAGLSPDTNPWQLVPNMKFTMDMFEPKSKRKLIGRAGGTSDMGMGIPKDAERHATQAALIQQGGVSKEPAILIKFGNGYELLEGWHRTIQHFARYPDGYVGPAYVAVAQGKPGVTEGFSNDMSTEDMIAYLRQHHDTNLHQDYLDHINTFSKFVLQNIPVNSIKTDLPALDRAKVEQYKQMDFSKAPPIVIGGGYILDGYHRANVAKALGIPTIKAYVGVQGQPGVAENMDHSQDGRAVEELKSALLAKRDQLQSATDDRVYDIIDKIMTRIARSHSISGQKLHDMWVDRYKQIPDTWIMNEEPGVAEDTQLPGDFKLMGQDLFLKNLAQNLKQRYPKATVKRSSDRVVAYHNKGDDERLTVMGTEVMDSGYIGVGLDDAFTESFQGVLVPTIKQTTEQLLAANPGTRPALFLSTDNWNPDAWTHIATKLGYRLVADDESLDENFADGKNPGRKGLAKRSGVNTKASVSTLRNVAKHSTGEKQRMAHWLANMKAGRAKARKK